MHSRGLATLSVVLTQLASFGHSFNYFIHSVPLSGPQVTIKNGTIQGVHSSTYNQDMFLGIPFASPPVNNLRFMNPVSYNKTFDGVFEANEYAPECYGYGTDDIGMPQSEDCLYLNVVRPAGYENETLPVGVWIHGGILQMGGTRDPRYNLTNIVNNGVAINKPFIAVSIAYRLSAWGFLTSEQMASSGNTNMGLRDQRLALHWIQENIHAFGGDPERVTIWGESAGAGSVGWHITAYNGRDDGLFRGAIMESGNPINYNSYHSVTYYQLEFVNLLFLTGCLPFILNPIPCLQMVPSNAMSGAIATTLLTISWQPIIDGDFIAGYSSKQLAEGAFVQVPIISGANTDEGTAFSPNPVYTEVDFSTSLTELNGVVSIPVALVPEILLAYPSSYSSWIPSITQLSPNYTLPSFLGTDVWRRSAGYFGDAVMIANRRATCQTWANFNIPAYSYRFDTMPAGIPAAFGVTHFQEVAFVFDNTNGTGYVTSPFAGMPEGYVELAGLMSKSWASFIYDLNPNNFTGREATGAPEWPLYTNDSQRNIVWYANDTDLAYLEEDDFRKEGIQWINDHAVDYQR